MKIMRDKIIDIFYDTPELYLNLKGLNTQFFVDWLSFVGLNNKNMMFFLVMASLKSVRIWTFVPPK